ncbi:MAG: pitrilysin family protein [Candidatus Izemoplasmatales bacterium]|jgi:predicted Zn-dependent peptidase
MQIRQDITVKESIYEITLADGMQVHMIPKPGFAKTEVALSVAYGAVDRDVFLRDASEVTTFPDGTAHFLEHMLFESESENISKQFSAVGANVNAYTSQTRTSYFFSTTNGITEPLRLLLNLIFFPNFSSELIDKERQIIAREIRMYRDDLDQTIFEDTLKALYHNHPIKTDIAGTEESIAKIDDYWLKMAYDTFYHPKNIHLVIVGDINPEALVAQIEKHPFMQLTRPNRLMYRVVHMEDNKVKRSLISTTKDLNTDMLMVGVKLDKTNHKTAFENDIDEIKLAFLLDNVLGKTSKTYQSLMNKRLINDTFEFSITNEKDYGYILLFTETKKPIAAKRAILDVLMHLSTYFTDEFRFLLAKRKMLGNFIQSFDHISSLTGFLTEYVMSGVDLFQLFTAVNNITFPEVKANLPTITKDSCTVVHYHR